MTETVRFCNIYEDANIWVEEVCAPCEHDGKEVLVFDLENEYGVDRVALTLEGAECLACGINYYLEGGQCKKERPAWQRYGRGLFYLAGLVSFVYLIIYLTQRLI